MYPSPFLSVSFSTSASFDKHRTVRDFPYLGCLKNYLIIDKIYSWPHFQNAWMNMTFFVENKLQIAELTISVTDSMHSSKRGSRWMRCLGTINGSSMISPSHECCHFEGFRRKMFIKDLKDRFMAMHF